MTDNSSITKLEFTWLSLTDQQQFRIDMKYELYKALKSNEGCKRDVYREIARKYNYTVERIEVIANSDLKKIDEKD